MSDDPSPPTDWAYPYWDTLADVAKFDAASSTRTSVFDTLCGLARSPGSGVPAVLSTTALADLVEQTLHNNGLLAQSDDYATSQFNQVYPEFEQLGTGYRLPKLSRDDQYYIFPGTPLSSWLSATPQDSFLQPAHEPEGYGTCLFGHYITTHNDVSNATAGTTLPLSALLYATVGMYAPINALSPDRAQTFTPETVDVSVSAGDIETLRTTEAVDLSTLAEQLTLDTTLPPVDYDVAGGAHDVGLIGRVTVPAEIPLFAHDLLEQRLTTQLESWLGSVLALYTPQEQLSQDREQPPENEDDEDDVDDTRLSRAQFANAVNTIASQPSRDHINRYGLDAQVTTPSGADRTQVNCLIYRRTNESVPVDPTAHMTTDADD